MRLAANESLEKAPTGVSSAVVSLLVSLNALGLLSLAIIIIGLGLLITPGCGQPT
jgi:hypothetical protein